MQITFAKAVLPTQGCAVFLVTEGAKLTGLLASLNKKSKGQVSRAIKSGQFKGETGKSLTLIAPGGTRLSRVVLFGLGKKPGDLKAKDFEDMGGRLAGKLSADGIKAATVLVEPGTGFSGDPNEMAAALGLGALLRSYRFHLYKTKKKAAAKPSLTKLAMGTADPAEARKHFRPLHRIADGVFVTRDLVSEPANILYPGEFASRAKRLADLGVKIEVLGEKKLKELGMGALLGVGQGSVHDSHLVTMVWNGSEDPKSKPVAFVGKGVTFDTGGISIKPAAGMEQMKWDMGGAGAVTGLMHALAARKAKAHVVGVIGLVENMPSSTAQRPGDVVTSLSGQTIEVINTDAEGRLVLADALWYTQDTFKPRLIIDLATLTGAIMVALGHEYAGLFCNNDELADRLLDAGEVVGEKLWRMPMGTVFDKMINSQIADMKNVGGRFAGSTTAAQFLERFVRDVPWAHLDIAGMAWSDKTHPTIPRGGTGFGVRLLDRLIADHYES